MMRTVPAALAALLACCTLSTASAAVPAVASCIDHTFVADARGGLHAMGTYAPGLVNASSGYSYPIRFPDLPGGRQVQDISCGNAFSLVLASDGTLWARGENLSGVFGVSTLVLSGSGEYVQVPGLPPIIKVSAGTAPSYPYVLAIDTSGNAWGWGENSGGQIMPAALDRGLDPVSPRRLSIPTAHPIVQVSASGSYSLALDQSGTVWIWGTERNFFGLGADHSSYQVVAGLPRIAEIAAGGYFALARATDGSVWSWGDSQYGELGRGPTQRGADPPYYFNSVPGRISSLTNVRAIAAGALHALALLADGSVWAWGANVNGELGDGSAADPINGGGSSLPVRLNTLGAVTRIFAGPLSSAALSPGGAVYMWGWNIFGRLGNGTYADQVRPQLMIGDNGDGFMDLTPDDPVDIPADKLPPFGIVLNATSSSTVTLDGVLKPKPEDVGKATNIYIFALAPASLVKDAPAWPKDSPVPCILAQLTATGELRAFSASTLQAAVTNTVLQASQAINVVTNATSSQLTLATLFAGTGTSPAAMLANGSNRAVASFSQQGEKSCLPQAPTTGWWWNSAEGGRGYSIEVRGQNLFFAAFHYDVSGRATWNFATGKVSADGAYFSGDLYGARGGQTLTGPYTGPQVASAGSIILAFNDATHGTMIWPGGAVPLERLPFVPEGLTAPAQANLPEAGWWWNPQENGRGFFVEWQNGYAQIAGYMYDASGNPIWYLSGGATPDPNAFSAPLRLYGNGQSMLGAYKPPSLVTENAGTLGLRFLTRDTATMTLPGGRQVPLERMRF